MSNTKPVELESFSRSFLAENLIINKWSELEVYTTKLLERKLESRMDFQTFIEDYSDWDNAVREAGSKAYIKMTCDTHDATAEKNYMDFVENIEPHAEKFRDQINRKIDAYRDKVSHPGYQRWFNSITNQIELFRAENLDIETVIKKETQAYQKIMGGILLEWEGEKKTLAQMTALLDKADRNIREKAWRLSAQSLRAEKDRMNELFERLKTLREEISRNAGFSNYRDYCFRRYERTDYTPKDCTAYSSAVDEVILPYYKKILSKRKEALQLSTLKPWDLSCGLDSGPALKPFDRTRDLVMGVGHIFEQVDQEFGEYFHHMKENKLLDLENRPGKAPGGYQCTLDEKRWPFIFMNSVGSNRDVFTLLHEAGHSFHVYYCRDKKLSALRESPMEFAEVASMSMERIGMTKLDEFYEEKDAARARLSENEDVFRLLIWVSMIDQFQHWIYTEKNEPREREEYWLSLVHKYACGVDWMGFEEEARTTWHKQLHLFEYPFYYIEYGIAQLGALQIGKKYEEGNKSALSDYKNGLRQGGTLGLKELFKSAQLEFGFTPDLIQSQVEPLYNQWLKDFELVVS